MQKEVSEAGRTSFCAASESCGDCSPPRTLLARHRPPRTFSLPPCLSLSISFLSFPVSLLQSLCSSSLTTEASGTHDYPPLPSTHVTWCPYSVLTCRPSLGPSALYSTHDADSVRPLRLGTRTICARPQSKVQRKKALRCQKFYVL